MDYQELQTGQTLSCHHCGLTLTVTSDCTCDGEECTKCEVICCGKPMDVSDPSDIDG